MPPSGPIRGQRLVISLIDNDPNGGAHISRILILRRHPRLADATRFPVRPKSEINCETVTPAAILLYRLDVWTVPAARVDPCSAATPVNAPDT